MIIQLTNTFEADIHPVSFLRLAVVLAGNDDLSLPDLSSGLLLVILPDPGNFNQAAIALVADPGGVNGLGAEDHVTSVADVLDGAEVTVDPHLASVTRDPEHGVVPLHDYATAVADHPTVLPDQRDP